MPKKDSMKNKTKNVKPLPDEFSREEEAGKFWDSHCLMDYEEFLETAENELNITERIFEVPVKNEMYQRLRQRANLLNQSIPQVLKFYRNH